MATVFIKLKQLDAAAGGGKTTGWLETPGVQESIREKKKIYKDWIVMVDSVSHLEKAYTVTVLYTSLNNAEVKATSFEVELKPDSLDYVRLEVPFEDYFTKLLPEAAFNIACAAVVKNTEWEYFAQDDFRVRKPDIKFSFQGKVISKQPVDVIIRLTNPLPIPLKKGLFYVEGPGIDKALRFKIAEIPVGGTAASTFKYTPPYAGRGTLIAKFTSKELDDVDGFLHFEIEPRPEDILMNGNGTRTNEVVRRTDVIP